MKTAFLLKFGSTLTSFARSNRQRRKAAAPRLLGGLRGLTRRKAGPHFILKMVSAAGKAWIAKRWSTPIVESRAPSRWWRNRARASTQFILTHQSRARSALPARYVRKSNPQGIQSFEAMHAACFFGFQIHRHVCATWHLCEEINDISIMQFLLQLQSSPSALHVCK